MLTPPPPPPPPQPPPAFWSEEPPSPADGCSEERLLGALRSSPATGACASLVLAPHLLVVIVFKIVAGVWCVCFSLIFAPHFLGVVVFRELCKSVSVKMARKFAGDELRRIMDCDNNIRNVSVVGHVRHGKTTLVNYLQGASGISRNSDTHADESERSIDTMKSTGYHLFYKDEAVGNEYLINLFDTPGHFDFSFEVTTALRMTDGSLVILDCIEGVCVQTEMVLKQAIIENIRPVPCMKSPTSRSPQRERLWHSVPVCMVGVDESKLMERLW